MVVVGVTLVAAAMTWLALAAPEALVTSVSLGVPFVPFGESTSRLATPVGGVALLLVMAAVALWVRGAWPVLRRADLLGALLLGGALGCIVLTFAAANPEKGDWFFFVTVDPGTGETKFAETQGEHDRNVQEFQAWCRANAGKC